VEQVERVGLNALAIANAACRQILRMRYSVNQLAPWANDFGIVFGEGDPPVCVLMPRELGMSSFGSGNQLPTRELLAHPAQKVGSEL